MRLRNVMMIAIAVFLLTFLIINAHVLSTPLALSFLVGTATLPVGALVLGLLITVSLACAAYIGLWQTSMLRDYRSQAKELERERQLAADAEASRLRELSVLVEGQVPRLEQIMGSSFAELRGELHNVENSLTAVIAELDDRIHHTVGETGTLRLPQQGK
jgi:uncharacterized integral membrane protein